MCVRYTLTAEDKEILRNHPLTIVVEKWEPHYNIAPTLKGLLMDFMNGLMPNPKSYLIGLPFKAEILSVLQEKDSFAIALHKLLARQGKKKPRR